MKLPGVCALVDAHVQHLQLLVKQAEAQVWPWRRLLLLLFLHRSASMYTHMNLVFLNWIQARSQALAAKHCGLAVPAADFGNV